MKNCKTFRYFVAVGKYYYGNICKDILSAQIQLAHARKEEPGLDWQIVEICA